MIIRAPPQRPVKFAIDFVDWKIVDAGVTQGHQPIRIKFPILIAIRACPLAVFVTPFISKTNRDAIALERPKFLDQTIFQLALPFEGEEGFDLLSSARKLRPVSPLAVGRIGERNLCRITAVPAILFIFSAVLGPIP